MERGDRDTDRERTQRERERQRETEREREREREGGRICNFRSPGRVNRSSLALGVSFQLFPLENGTPTRAMGCPLGHSGGDPSSRPSVRKKGTERERERESVSVRVTCDTDTPNSEP